MHDVSKLTLSVIARTRSTSPLSYFFQLGHAVTCMSFNVPECYLVFRTLFRFFYAPPVGFIIASVCSCPIVGLHLCKFSDTRCDTIRSLFHRFLSPFLGSFPRYWDQKNDKK
jgi:hypothetical protein